MPNSAGSGPVCVVCVDNRGYEASLEKPKIYRTLPAQSAAVEQERRGVDESADDYLYSSVDSSPSLSQPKRQSGIPEGMVVVTVEGEDYEAGFVKIAVNVMRKAGGTENVLPEVL